MAQQGAGAGRGRGAGAGRGRGDGGEAPDPAVVAVAQFIAGQFDLLNHQCSVCDGFLQWKMNGLRSIPCRHWFHLQCYAPNHGEEGINQCPICEQHINQAFEVLLVANAPPVNGADADGNAGGDVNGNPVVVVL